MSLDLLEKRPVWDADLGVGVEADYLVAKLADEAGVCIDRDTPAHMGNRVCLAAATLDVNEGLVVTCGRTAKRYRLRVTAEEIKDTKRRRKKK